MGEKRATTKKPPLLPVSMADAISTLLLPRLPSVQFLCFWALLTAGVMAGITVYDITNKSHTSYSNAPPKPFVLRVHVPLTEAEVLAVTAIRAGQLWCSAATAAALALMLPAAGLCRRALVLVALAATAANHYMYGRLLGIFFVPAHGDIRLVVDAVAILICGVVDVLGFLALLLGAE